MRKNDTCDVQVNQRINGTCAEVLATAHTLEVDSRLQVLILLFTVCEALILLCFNFSNSKMGIINNCT